jgi:aminopeptidase
MFFEYINKAAKLLTKHCADIKKGNIVLIWGSVETIPLINEIYREVLRNTDGHPIVKIDVPGQEYIFYKEAKDHQLDYANPFDLYLVKNIDVAIRLKTTHNTREMSNISPKKIKRGELAQVDIWKVFSEREGSGELNWIVFPYPSEGMAQEANMSKEEFGDLIIKTCFLDKPDPIATWK